MTYHSIWKNRGRNPDILTCISNLSNDEVFTPPDLANRMLDDIASAWSANHGGLEIWQDPNATFLDPCTKSGVFLREIVGRLVQGLSQKIPNIHDRVNHILTKQIFGIAITNLTGLLARRSVYCSKHANGSHSIASTFKNERGNIWFQPIDHRWNQNRCEFCGAPQKIFDREEGLENHAYSFIHTNNIETRIYEIFGAAMKFDVIIGNPPYQMTGGGGGSNDSAIYHLFVEQAIKLNPSYLSMVIPSRWMAGGRGTEKFRSTMLSGKHLANLVDYPNSAEVFPGVDLKSGVCYFLWTQKQTQKCAVTLIRGSEVVGPTMRDLAQHDVLIRDERAAKILDKVLAKSETSFEEILSGDTPFGLATNFTTFRHAEPRKDEVKVYASSNSGRRSGAMKRSAITKNSHLINEWKVLAPQAGPGNSGGHVIPDTVLGRPSVAEPNSVCTQTWIVAGPFKSRKHAQSASEYLTTSFVRFIVSLRKISQHAMKGVYRWVPQQDWSQTWTDTDLYKKYGITKSEIEYINRMIRPMDSNDE